MKRSAHPKGQSRREAAAESNVSAHFEGGTGVPPVSRASVPLAFPQTHAWGLDLSGTETGAGGVGGLLFVKLHATPGAPVLAPCDGTHRDWREPRETNRRFARQGETSARRERVNCSGNILAYLDCVTGQTLARYEYDPFGKLLLKEEDTRVAGRLHHQFSTKYTDEETGLSYYGFRYYATDLGRWLNWDPIGERGGLNLYGMVGNDPVNHWDYLGQGIGWHLQADAFRKDHCSCCDCDNIDAMIASFEGAANALADAIDNGAELTPFEPIENQVPGLRQAASPGANGYRSPSVSSSCQCAQDCVNSMEGLPAVWDAITLMLGRDWGKIERDRSRGVANCLKGVKTRYEACKKFKSENPSASKCTCEGASPF